MSTHTDSPPNGSSSINTYANTVKKLRRITKFKNPVDEQGFIFNCVPDLKVKQYLHALKTNVGGPKNIIAASKIEDNQIVIHLQSKEVLNEFFNKHDGKFSIDSHVIQCKRLSAPKTKIMLSHVNPSIPDSVLIEFIKDELKLDIDRDEVSYLRVDPSDDEFDHVISWRRQFFTTTEVIKDRLPGSILIKHENRNYRIFITTDEFTCFKCHAAGHKAEYCTATNRKELEYNSNFPNLPNQAAHHHTNDSSFQDDLSDIQSSVDETDDEETKMEIETNKTASKRPLSESSTSTQNPTSKNNDIKRKSSSRKKKPKPEEGNSIGDEDKSRTLKEIFEPVKDLISKNSNAHEYPFSIDNLAIFVDMCSGPNAQNTVQTVEQWQMNNKIPSLINMLQAVHGCKEMKDRGTKIKITKIISQLETIKK